MSILIRLQNISVPSSKEQTIILCVFSLAIIAHRVQRLVFAYEIGFSDGNLGLFAKLSTIMDVRARAFKSLKHLRLRCSGWLDENRRNERFLDRRLHLGFELRIAWRCVAEECVELAAAAGDRLFRP